MNTAVEVVVAHKRWEIIVICPLHGWQALWRMVLRAVKVGWKGVRDFIVEVSLLLAALGSLCMGEHWVGLESR